MGRLLVACVAAIIAAQGYWNYTLVQRVDYLQSDYKLPLGYIPKGSPIPDWAAKRSINSVAGIDLVGYLVRDEDGGYHVSVEPARKLYPWCGGHPDPLDPSPENRYVPCDSMVMTRENADFDGNWTTFDVGGEDLIAFESLGDGGSICCVSVVVGYVGWMTHPAPAALEHAGR